MVTDIKVRGDKPIEQIPSTKDKALRINLNENIYGTFAEIGAGQETVRNFFRAGASSGTIAKAMSAYDKDFSDAIYGIEEDNRYVTEPRLRRMLNHEVELIEDRILREKHPDKLFFAFANTVATIDFSKKFKGHGWVGVKFQLDPLEAYSEIILHLRFKETDARLQQETLGILGVNLIYGAYYKYNDPKKLLRYLYDHLDKDQLEIDTINFSGPRFANVDNRLMSLQLVKNGMTDAVMFGPDGKNILPAAVLYKKNILALRGSFRPVTKVNIDMLTEGLNKFKENKKVDENNIQLLLEITLSNLMTDGEVDERDFLDRADILCSLGYTVMISNYKKYYKLSEYLSRYTNARMGLIIGVDNLVEMFDEKYYRNLSGGILEAFGKLFYRDLKVYMYPYLDADSGEFINSENLKVHPRMKELYKFFKKNGKLVNIDDFDKGILDIFSRTVLKMILNGEKGWEEMLPKGIADIIKQKRLFGYSRSRIKK